MNTRHTGAGARTAAACASMLMALAVVPAAYAGSATHAYDSLGRLSKVTYSNGTVITYTYDAAGNRTAVVTAGAPG